MTLEQELDTLSREFLQLCGGKKPTVVLGAVVVVLQMTVDLSGEHYRELATTYLAKFIEENKEPKPEGSRPTH